MSLALLLAALAVIGLGPMVLTFQGARRRGQASGRAAFAGLFFPVTWALWYVEDDDPYERSGFRAARRRRRTAASGPG